MDPEDAVAATVNLQRDAGLMSSNLQILCQFVTSLQRMSSLVLSLAISQVVFPSQDAFDALRIVLVSGWGSVAGPVMLGPGLAHLLS